MVWGKELSGIEGLNPPVPLARRQQDEECVRGVRRVLHNAGGDRCL